MKRFKYKLIVSMDIIADDKDTAMIALDEMDYSFIELTGEAQIEKYEIADVELVEESDELECD
jgi:hypothetical protein